MNWEYLGRLIRRFWQLQLGYEASPIILKTGTLTATAPTGMCIYKFVSLSAANSITSAVDIDGNTVLSGDTPLQGSMVYIRLQSITFAAATGSVLVYVKSIKDDL